MVVFAQDTGGSPKREWSRAGHSLRFDESTLIGLSFATCFDAVMIHQFLGSIMAAFG
jgi:hypothetical protein